MRIRVHNDNIQIWFRRIGGWWAMKDDLKATVPGIRFNKNNDNINKSTWDVPLNTLSAEKVLLFASKYGYTFVDDAEQQIRRVVNKANETIAASIAVDANIRLAVKEGLNLLPYQKAGVVYSKNKDRILIADEMGLGKTIQALVLCNEWNAKSILIVCPASLKINWQREAQKWLINDHTYHVQKGGTKQIPLDASVVIINYDLLSKKKTDLMARHWDVVIVDECHNVKNTKLDRTKIIFGHEGKGQQTIKPISRTKTVLLTGTPLPNRTSEFWPFVHYCAPETFDSWYRYVFRYCAAYKETVWTKVRDKNTGRMRAVCRNIINTKGSSNEDELAKLVRSLFMVRRLKKDVLKELPPKFRQVIELPENGNNKLVKEGREWFKKNKNLLDQLFDPEQANPSVETPEFQELSKLRKELGVAKVPAAIDFIKEQLEADQKIVVFAHHREVLFELLDAFKDVSVMLIGGMTDEQKQQAVDRFQNDPDCKLFIGSILAAGVGITLTASSHVIFIEEAFRPADISQAADRLHRIGQQDNVLVQHLVFTESLDQYMINMLIAKEQVIKKVVDNVQEYKNPEVIATPEPEPAPKKESTYNMTSEQIEATHVAIKFLAGRCDGAVKEDAMGFNGTDTRFGHSLARQETLTAKQAFFGRKMADKYHRQYGEVLRGKMWGKKFKELSKIDALWLEHSEG